MRFVFMRRPAARHQHSSRGDGVEFGVNEHIALRVEALRYFMDGEKFTFPFNSGTTQVGGSLTTVRAELTFFLD